MYHYYYVSFLILLLLVVVVVAAAPAKDKHKIFPGTLSSRYSVFRAHFEQVPRENVLLLIIRWLS